MTNTALNTPSIVVDHDDAGEWEAGEFAEGQDPDEYAPRERERNKPPPLNYNRPRWCLDRETREKKKIMVLQLGNTAISLLSHAPVSRL